MSAEEAQEHDQFLTARVPSHQSVRSVVKASQLLMVVAESGTGITATQAARLQGMAESTTSHLLNTLLSEGMLSRDTMKRYQLGPKIAALAVAYGQSGPSGQLLRAVRDLASRTGETAHVSGWRDGQVVALATIEGSSPVRVGRIPVELRGAEHARATGKVMLAQLAPAAFEEYLRTHRLKSQTPQTIVDEAVLRGELMAVRRSGFAMDEAEFIEGVGCVAAPIFSGRVCIACLAVSAPLERFLVNRGELTKAVLAAASRASDQGLNNGMESASMPSGS